MHGSALKRTYSCTYLIVHQKFMLNGLSLKTKQEGNADPALNPDRYIFLLIFQHK